jgi:tetratricopeptide (TPR) repeat protein
VAYTFKHALTHEVAYGSLLLERRRGLHARIVEALEALVGERVAEQVEHLAQHALRGEMWDKALVYCRQAGEKAMAVALNDHHRLGLVLGFLSNYFHRMGTADQAVATAQRALALATAGGEVVLQALANAHLGGVYQAQGEYRRAIDCFEQTVASLTGERRHERFGQIYLPAVRCRANLASCHAELGTFAEGIALGGEGLRIAEGVAHPARRMIASWGIGLLALRRGDLPSAIPPARMGRGHLSGSGQLDSVPRDGCGLGGSVYSGWSHHRGCVAAHAGTGTGDRHRNRFM